MTADPILTLGWLILAHLVADFVIQTTGIVVAKRSRDGGAWRGLLAHGLGVALCLVPVALAFGMAGLWVLIAITLSHVVIDRIKVVATHAAEARALEEAQRRHEGRAPGAGLGRAWTPLPAVYFALDQVAHLTVIAVAWAIWLAGQAPTAEWSAAVGRVLGGRDQAVINEVSLVAVVFVSLLIANTRGGALWVATLVRPIEAATGSDNATGGATTATSAAAGGAAEAEAERPRGWSFRIGPFAGRVQADPAPPTKAAATHDSAVADRDRAPVPPAQVGATIGVLERLLIVTLLLVGADAAIGFVVAAKTIARFRLLDDRDFAEYYLLGTLASVSVAIVTALAARAALPG
jgi:Protein of unknown function (DUF3307)